MLRPPLGHLGALCGSTAWSAEECPEVVKPKAQKLNLHMPSSVPCWNLEPLYKPVEATL